MLTREEDGMLEVNKQYQEAFKIVINLATASLVLPIVFAKSIGGVSEPDIKGELGRWAYSGWFLLVLSLCFCLLFYYCSTKFTKALYRGASTTMIEKCRDAAAAVAVPTFALGLICLLIFFLA